MLVLKVKQQEPIQIGEAKVVVLAVRGSGDVVLGFVAPPDVAVVRESAKVKKRAEHTQPRGGVTM